MSRKFRVGYLVAMRSRVTVLNVYAALLLPLCVSSSLAKEWRIGSQQDFDALRVKIFDPGDRILFKRAERFRGMFSPAGNGTRAAPIRIAAYGQGTRPRIDALGANTAGLLLRNASFWEVDELEITNTDGSDGDQGTLFGIYVVAEKEERTYEHVYINDCHIHDVNGKVAGKRRGGIHVHIKNLQSSVFHDLRITNNRITRIGGVGIANDSSCGGVELRGDDTVLHHLWTKVYVAGNYIKDTGRNSVIARVSRDAIYEHNTLANSSRHDTGHSIFCFNTAGIKIQFNEAYGNVGEGGKDRGGFDADYNCVDTFIQYNYSHDNLWFCGIMKKRNRNVVIRYNVSQNDREGIYFYGFENSREVENVHIYNNTHFVPKGLRVSVFPEGRTPINTRFENNIFYFEEEGSWGSNARGVNTTFANNLYFNLPPHESDSSPRTADPRFVAPGRAGTDIDLKTMAALRGYRLRADSPCIGAGTQIYDDGGRDILGVVKEAGRTGLGAVGRRP